MKDYKQEQNELLRNYLERTFFSVWRGEKKDDIVMLNYNSLELDITNYCDHKCVYCYLERFGKELFPRESVKKRNILSNLEKIMRWLNKNGMRPKIELFGGTPLSQEIGHQVIEIIYEYAKNWGKDLQLIVPDGSSFILYPKYYKKTKEWIKKFKEIGAKFHISHSVDGKYLEELNRPLKRKNIIRDDKYYEELFKFASENKFGFHPMIYSQGIELWKDNFLWFQEMYKKYNIWKYNLYLLEVRNAEWTEEQIIEFGKFIEFLIEWVVKEENIKYGNQYFNLIMKTKGFNILSHNWSEIGRGIGCSIQSALMLRLGDLKFGPCHRTMYKPFEIGKFIFDDNNDLEIEAINPEIWFAIVGMDIKYSPQCEKCLIRDFCNGGCLGAQYETTGDLFSPIPTVCQLEHWKIISQIKAMKKLNIYGGFLSNLPEYKIKKLKKLEELI